METIGEIECRAGQGIAGDMNADPSSPRQVLLVSASTLAAFGLIPGDLRENIVVDEDVERLESGQCLRIGKHVIVRITYACEPCFRLDETRKGLSKAIGIRRGKLGRVISGGRIRVGDRTRVLKGRLPAFPDEPYQRILLCLKLIPKGKVATYRSVIQAVGLARSYTRVFPYYLRRASAEMLVHRVVSSNGSLVFARPREQKRLLKKEGVAFGAGERVDPACFWAPAELFGSEEGLVA